jgi:hypothetical protein
MSSTPKDPFVSITPDSLEKVAGGLSRSSSNDQVTALLTSITSSIKDLTNKNQSDPTQMLLLMMMMGGFGGGGGAVIGGGVAGGFGGAVAGPPVINVDTGIAGGGGPCGFPGPIFGGGCGGKGKKGW